MFHRIAFESGIWGVFCLCLVCGAAGCAPIEEEENDDTDTLPECNDDEITRVDWCDAATAAAYANWCASCEDEKACEGVPESHDDSMCDLIEMRNGDGTVPECIPTNGPAATTFERCIDWIGSMACDDYEVWPTWCDFR